MGCVRVCAKLHAECGCFKCCHKSMLPFLQCEAADGCSITISRLMYALGKMPVPGCNNKFHVCVYMNIVRNKLHVFGDPRELKD